MIKRVALGIIALVLYVLVAIPIIVNILMPITIDWINNSADLLVINQSSVRYVFNDTTKTFDAVTTYSILDLRPALIFIIQLTVYFMIPLFMILSVGRIK